LLVLDCGVLHDVEALEESAPSLTIPWRREKSDTLTILFIDSAALRRRGCIAFG
jgi:hypothetical protein